MGLQIEVKFPDALPGFPPVREKLAELGFEFILRMVDGELVFPTDPVPAHWVDLRLSTPAGPLTLRRAEQTLVLVTWGNADDRLLRWMYALAWALADAGSGQIVVDGATHSAAAFQAKYAPDGWRAD